jgi:hypothetical protein
VQTEAGDRDKQLRIMTDQNAELLRLLEQEEAQSTRYSADAASASRELETLRSRYGSLLTTAKAHEDAAGRAAREGQLRSEEVRLLRAEAEALRVGGGELRLKAQVTVLFKLLNLSNVHLCLHVCLCEQHVVALLWM